MEDDMTDNKDESQITDDIFNFDDETEDVPLTDDEKYNPFSDKSNHPDLLDEPLNVDEPTSQVPAKSATPEPEPNRNVTYDDYVKSIERTEEIEAELVREQGRYMPNVDNAQVGKTIYGDDNTKDPNHTVQSMIFAQQQHPSYRSAGINTNDPNNPNQTVLDTGADAQTVPEDYKTDIDDPRSPDFMVCMNNQCPYRENCLRYRLKNKRDNKGLFFPEQCRIDGTFLSTTDSDFTGYDSVDSIDNPTPPTNLGATE